MPGSSHPPLRPPPHLLALLRARVRIPPRSPLPLIILTHFGEV